MKVYLLSLVHRKDSERIWSLALASSYMLYDGTHSLDLTKYTGDRLLCYFTRKEPSSPKRKLQVFPDARMPGAILLLSKYQSLTHLPHNLANSSFLSYTEDIYSAPSEILTKLVTEVRAVSKIDMAHDFRKLLRA